MLQYPFFVPFSTLEPIMSIPKLGRQLFVFAVSDDDEKYGVSLFVGFDVVVVSSGFDMVQSSF